jgi:hypothetical protein
MLVPATPRFSRYWSCLVFAFAFVDDDGKSLCAGPEKDDVDGIGDVEKPRLT